MPSSEQKIIKQYRRQSRLSFVFSVNLFFAACAVFALIFLLKEEFSGFSPLKLVGFLTSLNLPRVSILLLALAAAVLDVAVSAYFIKYLPKKRRERLAQRIKADGKRGKGEIIKMEVHKKSIYETVYKAVLRLEGEEKEVFCFYTVDKNEPLPIGEIWRLFYKSDSGFAVLTKRILYNEIATA